MDGCTVPIHLLAPQEKATPSFSPVTSSSPERILATGFAAAAKFWKILEKKNEDGEGLLEKVKGNEDKYRHLLPRTNDLSQIDHMG